MCPLNKFKECRKHDCDWYTHILGKNPQSDVTIDRFGCAMFFLPILLIENSQMSRQTGAAVESFRNEMVQKNDMVNMLIGHIQNKRKEIEG